MLLWVRRYSSLPGWTLRTSVARSVASFRGPASSPGHGCRPRRSRREASHTKKLAQLHRNEKRARTTFSPLREVVLVASLPGLTSKPACLRTPADAQCLSNMNRSRAAQERARPARYRPRVAKRSACARGARAAPGAQRFREGQLPRSVPPLSRSGGAAKGWGGAIAWACLAPAAWRRGWAGRFDPSRALPSFSPR